MLKRAKENKKGFTLAELLIVVAIIAVLVAISIPIFTSQLEKSREAVDLANIRAAYAEVMTAALTEDTTATNTQTNVKYDSSNNTWSKDVTLNQKNDDWQTDVTNVTIGEVSIKDTKPKAGKTATISVSIDTAGESTPSVAFATN